MKINVNKDITTYKREQFKGLSAEEISKAVICFVIVISFIVLLVKLFHVPTTVAVFLDIPLATFCVLVGYVRPDNMSFLEWLRSQTKWSRKEPLLFRSIHDESELLEMASEKSKQKEKKKEEKTQPDSKPLKSPKEKKKLKKRNTSVDQKGGN